LEGHYNVVYTVTFNNSYRDKVLTGSFNFIAKLWDSRTGENYYIYQGHNAKIG